MTGRNNHEIKKKSTKRTTKKAETVKKHETQDASQEHQELIDNEPNTGVSGKASERLQRLQQNNKENETNNSHLTEKGNSRKRKFESTVKSSAVVKKRYSSQINGDPSVVDVSHSIVTTTHTKTTVNGATGDSYLSAGAYAQNIENISEVVTSKTVRLSHLKKQRSVLSRLARTNNGPSPMITITEASVVDESEAVVTRKVTSSRNLLSVPIKPQRRMKKHSLNADNHVSIISNGGHTSILENKSECIDNGATNNNFSSTNNNTQPSTSQAAREEMNQNQIQANGPESTGGSPHEYVEYVEFNQNSILANSTLISPEGNDKQTAVAAKKVTKRTQKATKSTTKTKPKETARNSDGGATASSTERLRRSTRKKIMSKWITQGPLSVYDLACQRANKNKPVRARVKEARSDGKGHTAMHTEKTTFNRRDLDWFNDLCDPNMSLKDQGKIYDRLSSSLQSMQIDCSSFGKIRYVLDGEISYGYFSEANRSSGVMRFPEGALTSMKSSKNNMVMKVLNGLFEVRQSTEAIKVKPGTLIIKAGTSYSIKYLESAVGVILFHHYSLL